MESAAARQQPEDAVRFPSTTRIPELDGLRGTAILLVLLFHCALFYRAMPGTLPANIARIAGLGWSGVDLFFVLSGFLIGGILMDHRRSGSYFRTFYVRRVFRIFPAYYLLILLYAIPIWFGVTDGLPGLYEPDRLSLWLYLFDVQNIGMAIANTMDSPFVLVTWSLAIEEQFYVLLPLVVRFVSPRALMWVSVIFVVSSPLIRAWLFEPLPGMAFRAYLLLPCRWDALFLGVIAAGMVRNPRTASWLAENTRWLYGLLGALGLAVASLGVNNPNSLTTHMAVPGYTVIALFFTVLLLVVLHAPHRYVRRMARARWLRWLGDISYPLYLVHFPMIVAAHWLALGAPPKIVDGPSLAVTAAAIVASLSLAWLSTRTFERFFIRIGRRHLYAPPPPEAS